MTTATIYFYHYLTHFVDTYPDAAGKVQELLTLHELRGFAASLARLCQEVLENAEKKAEERRQIAKIRSTATPVLTPRAAPVLTPAAETAEVELDNSAFRATRLGRALAAAPTEAVLRPMTPPKAKSSQVPEPVPKNPNIFRGNRNRLFQ